MKTLNILGKQFGRLTVVSKTDTKDTHGNYLYFCKCACGNTKIASGSLVNQGKIKSCGCLRRDIPNRFSHLMSHTREYKIWAEMRKRCLNPNQKTFSYYGGRGIEICKRWGKFENFHSDMGNCPEGFTLDRINPDGNYEPSNCRWASVKTQTRNRRQNHLITFNGKTQCLAAWAEEIGITYGALKQRIKRNWSLEKALAR